MRAHIQLIAWMQIIVGGLVTTAGLMWSLVWPRIGATITSADFSYQAGSRTLGAGNDGLGEFFRLCAAFAVAMVLCSAVPSILSGISLLRFKPYARPLGIVVSGLNVLFFVNPFGLIVGIYGLVILLNRETIPLFQPPTTATLQ